MSRTTIRFVGTAFEQVTAPETYLPQQRLAIVAVELYRQWMQVFVVGRDLIHLHTIMPCWQSALLATIGPSPPYLTHYTLKRYNCFVPEHWLRLQQAFLTIFDAFMKVHQKMLPYFYR
jgi:hypothetical protein